MKKYLLIMTLAFVFNCEANQMFKLKPSTNKSVDKNAHQLIFTANTKVDQYFKLNITFTADTLQDTLSTIDIIFDKYNLPVISDLLTNVSAPKFKELDVYSDAGVYGDFVYIFLPFGDKHTCHFHNKKQIRRKELFVLVNGNEIGFVKINDACKDPWVTHTNPRWRLPPEDEE